MNAINPKNLTFSSTLALTLLLTLTLALTWVFSLRPVRLKIGDYYFKQGKFDQAVIWYGKVVRKWKLKVNQDKNEYLRYKDDSAKLTSVLDRKKEANLLKVSQVLGLDQTKNYDLQNVLKNLLMGLDFSTMVTKGHKTYFIDWMGKKILVEGLVNIVEGPWKGSKSLMVEGIDRLTRISGPPSGLNLSEGSLAVWARLIDPKKMYSALVSVNDHSQIYIYHQGASGSFHLLYNGLMLGATQVPIIDDKWHHYVFTWKNGEQKFYIDNREVFSSAAPCSTSQTTTFYIGWVGTSYQEQWHGPMAQFLTFDCSLAASEVTALYRFRASIGEGAKRSRHSEINTKIRIPVVTGSEADPLRTTGQIQHDKMIK